MFDALIGKAFPGDNIVIGLGDSFTQGVGSWSEETYKANKGWIDPLNTSESLYPEMYENSWVSQLCKYYLTGYKPINLGQLGKGNRAAVKELYLNPQACIPLASDVIVVYMLSGMERFDFVNKDFTNIHFTTMWPNPWDEKSPDKKLWKAYATSVWSEKFICIETLLNIKEAETFCKAHGYKFVITSAFEQRFTKEYFINTLGAKHEDLINSIPWDNVLYPKKCKSFIELLLHYDGRPELAYGEFYDVYSKLKKPTQYITNCCHPTREGYRIIAEELSNFIKEKGYV